MNWRPFAQVFLPSWQGFVLGVSKLGSTDQIGLPNINEGRWVDVTCDTGSIDIRAGYQAPHPLSMYQTGTADVKMIGATWAPSINTSMLPGNKVRLGFYKSPTTGQFADTFDSDFLTITESDGTYYTLFYGYILDIEEVVGSSGDTETVTMRCVDEWIRLVRLPGDLEYKSIAFNTVPTYLTTWGINNAVFGTLATDSISQFGNSQRAIERAVLSTMGSAWVEDDTVYISDSDIWQETSPTVSISDVHIGDHLCYTDFDKRSSVSFVMNSISQTNVKWEYNSVLGEDTLNQSTTDFKDTPSVILYGDSGHRIETSLVTNNWDGNTYLTAGRYPEVATRSVDVYLDEYNVHLLPTIHDTVSFTNRGTTENRRVSNRSISIKPNRWEATLDFFDFLLFDIAAP